MNASDFAKFFDFSIEWVENEQIEEDMFFYGTRNEDNTFTGYKVTDDQSVFRTRYIDVVGDLTDCFDSMLLDYIDSTLEEYGCPDKCLNDYEKAKDWIEKSCPDLQNTDLYHMICCFVDKDLIFDDVALDKTFSPLDK